MFAAPNEKTSAKKRKLLLASTPRKGSHAQICINNNSQMDRFAMCPSLSSSKRRLLDDDVHASSLFERVS